MSTEKSAHFSYSKKYLKIFFLNSPRSACKKTVKFFFLPTYRVEKKSGVTSGEMRGQRDEVLSVEIDSHGLAL